MQHRDRPDLFPVDFHQDGVGVGRRVRIGDSLVAQVSWQKDFAAWLESDRRIKSAAQCGVRAGGDMEKLVCEQRWKCAGRPVDDAGRKDHGVATGICRVALARAGGLDEVNR